MKEEAFFELLAQARGERPPAIDVAARVANRVRYYGAERDWEWPLVALSGVSVLAAAVAVAVAITLWSPLVDPLSALFNPCLVVMQ